MKSVTLEKFQDKLQEIRVGNNWVINLEFNGIWIITVYDRETDKKLASTGSTGLYGVLASLEKPFNVCPWV